MHELFKYIVFILIFNFFELSHSSRLLSKEKREYIARILNTVHNNQTSQEKFQSLSLVTTDELEQFLHENNQDKNVPEPTFMKQQSEDYCNSKAGGFYDDPNNCENFIICFADKTFKIPCAYGTLWDHVKKQCDYIERIDCERKTTIPTTPSTSKTTKKVATSKRISKKFERPQSLTSKNSITTTTQNTFYLTNKIKNNILLLSIIIPLFLFVITSIFISLWFYKRKKRLRQERIELNSYLQNIKSNFNLTQPTKQNSSFTEEIIDTTYYSNNTIKSPIIHKKSQVSKVSKWRKSKSKVSDSNFKTISTTHKMNDIIKNKNNIAQMFQQNKSNPKLNEFTNSEHQVAIEFSPNLSFNLEENNWGYNFATRGLDLNQPWSSGQYIPSMVESNNSKSALNPINKTNHNHHMSAKNIEPKDKKSNIYLNNLAKNYFY